MLCPFGKQRWHPVTNTGKIAEYCVEFAKKHNLKFVKDDANNVVISFIGDTTKLSDKLQLILNNAVETTKNNTGVHLQIAFNYGARAEIVKAVQDIVNSGIKTIDETTISNYLH